MRNRGSMTAGIAVLLSFFLFQASPAEARRLVERGWEGGVLLGLQLPDEDLTGHGPDASDNPLVIGLRGDRPFHDNWGVFADVIYSSIGSERPSGDASMLAVRIGPELFVDDHMTNGQFFFEGGVGLMNVGFDDADSFTRPILSAGFGQRIGVSERGQMRWELRTEHTLGDTDGDAIDKTIGQGEFLVGFSWAVGGKLGEDDRSRKREEDRDLERDAGRDSDGDGVEDGADRCPDTPRGWPVDSRGCALDTDGDGVANGADRCPDTPSGVRVDSRGCALDGDGDGVPDSSDRCPNTPRGTAVDANGCPEKKLFSDSGKALVLEGVNFETSSDRLTEGSRAVLDEMAQSLEAWPAVRVEIGGYTDSRGAADFNRDLSRQRAQSVKDYLVTRGVDASRLEVRGYGPDSPIADNATADGRRKNRRVELKQI